jgi:hypothetical protein
MERGNQSRSHDKSEEIQSEDGMSESRQESFP